MPLTSAEVSTLSQHILMAQKLTQETFLMIVDPNSNEKRVEESTARARAANELLVAYIESITEK